MSNLLRILCSFYVYIKLVHVCVIMYSDYIMIYNKKTVLLHGRHFLHNHNQHTRYINWQTISCNLWWNISVPASKIIYVNMQVNFFNIKIIMFICKIIMYVDIQVTDLLRDCNPFRYIYILYTQCMHVHLAYFALFVVLL